MSEFEEKLGRALEHEAPQDLDRRVRTLLTSTPELSGKTVFRRPVPLWACAVACVFCLACGFVMSQAQVPAASEIRYVEESAAVVVEIEASEGLLSLIAPSTGTESVSFFEKTRSDVQPLEQSQVLGG